MARLGKRGALTDRAVWLGDDVAGVQRLMDGRGPARSGVRRAVIRKFSRFPIMSPQLSFELYISQELDLGYNERSWGQTGKVRCESWLDLFRYEIYFSPLRRLREMLLGKRGRPHSGPLCQMDHVELRVSAPISPCRYLCIKVRNSCHQAI